MTVLEFLNKTAMLCGVLASGESLPANESSDALESLNDLLGSWSSQGLLIPAAVRESFSLVSGTASYDMGASEEFNTTRPTNVLGVSVVVNSQESKLDLISLQEYQNIADKTLTGIPSKVYVEYNSPDLTLKYYPVPDSTYSTVIYSTKPLTAYSSLTTEIELPPGYSRALRYNLAVEMAVEYGKEVSRIVLQTANDTKADLMRANATPGLLTSDLTNTKNYNIFEG
jgi:hypothetical protein